jgi:hypothetical protein
MRGLPGLLSTHFVLYWLSGGERPCYLRSAITALRGLFTNLYQRKRGKIPKVRPVGGRMVTDKYDPVPGRDGRHSPSFQVREVQPSCHNGV